MKEEIKDIFDILTIVGPTASGKTALAVAVARALNGEIISGDSRQIYRGMTLGTGKDLDDYVSGGDEIKAHLIDIADAGDKYNIYDYQRDFLKAYNDIRARGKLPILCGGSGMYVECVLRGYRMIPVPENRALRNSLEGKSLEELTEILKSYGKKLHNTTDVDTPKRAIRAIEIEDYYQKTPVSPDEFPEIKSVNVCLELNREERWRKIEKRLKERLNAGLADEIRGLLGKGGMICSEISRRLSEEELMYYGLEYKYVTLYVTGKICYDEMFEKLNIAIRQFAKRQMTWFRGMERRGIRLHWLNASLCLEEKTDMITELWRNENKRDILFPNTFF